MATFVWPKRGGVRGLGFWGNPRNWIASRKKFRRDHTVAWRQRYESTAPLHPDRQADYSALAGPRAAQEGFKFVILGDTGEGDRSQIGLLPLIRALNPDFIVINGDLAYPAGRESDYLAGFFEPYQNLRLPIWAVPGNHEYYSPHNGREFFDLFCTSKHQRLWADHGLKFVQQPGTYWELSSPECPLVVLAIDSGMTAGLDPKHGLLFDSEGDIAQLAWLERRLARCDALGKKALILFHIPSLVNLRQAKKPRLARLHGIIGRFSNAVGAVVTAHEHSFQYYLPADFARFISSDGSAGPSYFVSGSGGAFLSPTDFSYKQDPLTFKADYVFPDAAQWKTYAGWTRKAANLVGGARNWAGRTVNSVVNAVFETDSAKYQSLLLVETKPDGNGILTATMTAYFQQSLEQLYASQPSATVVVADGHPRPHPDDVARLTLRDVQNPGSALTIRLS